jgi:hypothetical protein
MRVAEKLDWKGLILGHMTRIQNTAICQNKGIHSERTHNKLYYSLYLGGKALTHSAPPHLGALFMPLVFPIVWSTREEIWMIMPYALRHAVSINLKIRVQSQFLN